MSKDNIQSGSAKSLGFGKAFVALSRTTVLTIASIKQKFKPGAITSDLPNEAKDKKQRKATLAKIQAKNKAAKKKSDKGKKKNKRKSMKKNKRTFNVPKHRSKARIEKRTRFGKVKKLTTLSKDSYLNVKNFFKRVHVVFCYTGWYQQFGNPEYPLNDKPRNSRTKSQERKYGPTRFKLFQTLPKEIRSKIWRATFESRIVTVEAHIKFDIEIRKMTLIGAKMTVPLALSVCRDSRAEALLWYRDLVPEHARPIYFHPTLDSFAIMAMRSACHPDPRERFEETRYTVKDALWFLGHMGSLYKQIPKFVGCITIPRAFWSNERYWDTKMQLAWNEGWGYDGLREIVVLQYQDYSSQDLEHEKFLTGYFKIIKRKHPGCSVPRIRIISDFLGYSPYSSDEFSSIMGQGMYEDIVREKFKLFRCDACWIKWFESDF
ncbi:predicted protein [Botrytis cinerea T4]|uniref:2EXR domain-containing protein n=1 Tax=Botryotinia fuckeliana (strain T4) TaxID=999810 RepID=G2YBS6_BOTF4|nr:predicted protein [Botrytis cinerea T4]